MLLTLLVAHASAAADLATSISAPTVPVYTSARYTVTVTNVGNQTSGAASVTLQLPVTHTSPSVYVMGTVGAKSSTCTQSGTTVVCSLPTIRRGRSTSVYVDLTLPESTDALVVTATSTLSGDTNANNVSSKTAALTNPSISFAGGDIWSDHCTGTALTSFYECTLFPSSISGFASTLNADFTVTIDGQPDYGGTWSQPTADSLVITYTELGTEVAAFEGYGVSADCWEGLTTFPTGTWVSPYQVCR